MTKQDYLDRMREDMELRNLSDGTMKVYSCNVARFIRYCEDNDFTMDEDAFRQYLIDKKDTVKLRTYNVYNSSIRFFLRVTLQQDINIARTPRLRVGRSFPEVFTVDEVMLFFSVIDDLKFKAIFFNIYGSGLRCSEIIKLRVSDIDSANMRLLIYQGKGRKDRYTILSEAGLIALREYWKAYHPVSEEGYLFPGRFVGHYSTGSVEKAFRMYYKKTGLTKKATVHTLRHSFATHLLENGTEALYIKDLLGHTTLSTTTIYLHLANLPVYKTVSPLDKVLSND